MQDAVHSAPASSERAATTGKLGDGTLIDKYNFFIFDVVKAPIAPSPRHPQSLH
jgi:hypothetical protein